MLSKQVLRGVEKLPGVNLLQVAHFGDRHVLMLPKVGSRTIRNAVLEHHGLGRDPASAWEHVSYTSRHGFARRFNKPDTIVVLRDPLDRLHSCWKQKVSSRRDPGRFYFFQYRPLLRPDMPFLDFLAAIARIPVPLQEKHFIPLRYFLGGLSPLRVTLVPIGALDKALHDILGSDAAPRPANTTGPVAMPDEAAQLFERRMLARYGWDRDLFLSAGRGFPE